MSDIVSIYIDGGYLDAILKKQKIKINYDKFVKDICRQLKCTLLRAYYYDCLPYKDDNSTSNTEKLRFAQKEAFLTLLNRIPYFDVKRGRLDRHKITCSKCGFNDFEYKQKLIDNLITVDIVSHSWRGLVDKIVLISGDSDFVPAIKEAKEAGVITILFYSTVPGSYIHNQIRDLFDDRFEMDLNYLKQFEL